MVQAYGKIAKAANEAWNSLKDKYGLIDKGVFISAFKVIHGIGGKTGTIELSSEIATDVKLALCLLENYPEKAAGCRVYSGVSNRGAGTNGYVSSYSSTSILHEIASHEEAAKRIYNDIGLRVLANNTFGTYGNVLVTIERKFPNIVFERKDDRIQDTIDKLVARGQKIRTDQQQSTLGDADGNKPGNYL